MKSVGRILLVALLAGCSDREPTIAAESRTVGSDKDEHGCIGSAGYQWCDRTNKCERPWELAAQAGFENTESEFEKYCGQ